MANLDYPSWPFPHTEQKQLWFWRVFIGIQSSPALFLPHARPVFVWNRWPGIEAHEHSVHVTSVRLNSLQASLSYVQLKVCGCLCTSKGQFIEKNKQQTSQVGQLGDNLKMCLSIIGKSPVFYCPALLGSHCSSRTMEGSFFAPSTNSSSDSLPSLFVSICLKILSVRFSGVDSSSGIFITEETIL